MPTNYERVHSTSWLTKQEMGQTSDCYLKDTDKKKKKKKEFSLSVN